MESILQLSTESCERSIKFNKKFFRGQMVWVLFNISILLFDWFEFVNSPSRLTSFSFGAMAITVVWSVFFLMETWSDLKNEKHYLKILTEHNNIQLASGERQQYIFAKEQYELLTANLKEKANDTGIQ